MAVLASLCVLACEKDTDKTEISPDSQFVAPTVMEIGDVIVDANNNKVEAVTFNWSDASFGAPVQIQYSLYLTYNGNEGRTDLHNLTDRRKGRSQLLCMLRPRSGQERDCLPRSLCGGLPLRDQRLHHSLLQYDLIQHHHLRCTEDLCLHAWVLPGMGGRQDRPLGDIGRKQDLPCTGFLRRGCYKHSRTLPLQVLCGRSVGRTERRIHRRLGRGRLRRP